MHSPTDNFHGWLIIAPGVPPLQVLDRPSSSTACEECSNVASTYLVVGLDGRNGTITCHGCLVGAYHHRDETGEKFYRPVS